MEGPRSSLRSSGLGWMVLRRSGEVTAPEAAGLGPTDFCRAAGAGAGELCEAGLSRAWSRSWAARSAKVAPP